VTSAVQASAGPIQTGGKSGTVLARDGGSWRQY